MKFNNSSKRLFQYHQTTDSHAIEEKFNLFLTYQTENTQSFAERNFYFINAEFVHKIQLHSFRGKAI